VVAISAGNSGPWAEMAENNVELGMGYLYNTDVSLDTVGQPGSFTNSLAVASVENDGMVGYYVTVGGQMIVYNEDNRDGQFTNQLFRTIAGEHDYIFIDGVGKAEDWEAIADVLPGKIALCSRGETNFVEKATLAVEAGAKAVFIYNNQSGMITLDLTDYTYSNPVAALSQVQGAIIRAASTPVTDENGNVKYLTGKMVVSNTIGLGTFDSEFATMSSFSSWGVPGSLEMKPEITAPGGNIYSIQGSTPENGRDTDEYRLMSGTSMASPQVAGMSALMSQYIRENDLTKKTGLTERQLIQSLLMSTAEPLLVSEGVYYPILQQGAGLANVHDAMTAGSFITMAPDAKSGAADGKVKVELFDDPDRSGAYTAAFTVNNLTGEEKVIDLNADFFVQAVFTEGEHTYLDYTTTQLPMDVIWTVDGIRTRSAAPKTGDFNGDGVITTADGQTLLDYATGLTDTLNEKASADVDGDGDIDSHDAYLFLRSLSVTSTTVPAGGSVDIRVSFTLSADTKAELDENYPNGTYIQGFLYADVAGDVTHSIPVLGFYGNWTDPSMFDVGVWSTYATGEDTRIPYVGRTRGNEFHVMYEWDPGYMYSFSGNPIIADSRYMPERNAMNSADTIDSVSFIAIRHADQSRVQITNETSGKVIMDQATGAVNMAYYYGALGWQNSGLSLTTNFSLENEAEGDEISMAFTLIPEYYIDEEGMVDFEALGKGATL
ncbi:MAG: S8 family serine peptidase, partial [Oscillospiraceae bacterium]|nr:S8 family serine peptidase [Oscillospiraceae bacterium]